MSDKSIHDEFFQAEKEKRNKAKTLSRKQMSREHKELRSKGELLKVLDAWHPEQRSECSNLCRPCLFVSCRHHLYLDVNTETGSVKYNFPDKEVHELTETCALDVAERGGATLDEVGNVMNLTRERIRQIELTGIAKLNKARKNNENIEIYADWDPRQNEND